MAAVLLAGCSDPRDCSLEGVAYDFVGSAALDNCGDLYRDSFGNYDAAAYRNAQACVIDHVQQQHAFFVRWRIMGVDTYEIHAYAGVMRDGTWSVAAFQQYGGTRGEGPAERDSCTDLVLGSPCSLGEELCVQCVGQKPADTCEP